MDEDQVVDEQGTDTPEEVDNGGVVPGDAEEQGIGTDEQGLAAQDDPHRIKKRLGMQAKKHQRELRALHEKIAQMQSMLAGGDMANPQNQMYQSDPYPSPGQPSPASDTEEARIQRAVRMALGMKEYEQRQAEEAEKQAHVHKQYQRLNDEFDRASELYDDFDEAVRDDGLPFTPHMRDALLLIENPAEVAYKLGKNRKDLERISKLHPLEQVREINKLSFSLMNGNLGKQGATAKAAPMTGIRNNPAYSSNAITDKTPPSQIRARMKAGTWK